jgi:topoisomerase-4 subunit A
LLIFALDELPEMSRGKGVRLQRYKDAEAADARAFSGEDGLSWTDGAGRVHNRPLADLADWTGSRAQAGRLIPKELKFPANNSFGGTGL